MLSIKTLSALLTFSAIGLAAPAPEESNTSTWEDTEFNEVLAKACVNRHQTRDDVLNVWGDVNCVLAAVGSDIDEQRIDKFLRHNFKEIVEDVPESVELNAAPDNVLALLADDNDRITYVSFIGTYLESDYPSRPIVCDRS